MAIRVEVVVVTHERKAHAGELASEGDKGGGRAQAALAQRQIVRLPVGAATALHGRVEEQAAQFGLALLRELASSSSFAGFSDPNVHIHRCNDCAVCFTGPVC